MNEILRFMQKRDERTHIRKVFYNLPTTAFARRREIKIQGTLMSKQLHLDREITSRFIFRISDIIVHPVKIPCHNNIFVQLFMHFCDWLESSAKTSEKDL